MHNPLIRALVIPIAAVFFLFALASGAAAPGGNDASRSAGGADAAGNGAARAVFADGLNPVDGPEAPAAQPLRLASHDNDKDKDNDDKIDVCEVKKNGKFKDKRMTEEQFLKKKAKDPDRWFRGKCKDVISPSEPGDKDKDND